MVTVVLVVLVVLVVVVVVVIVVVVMVVLVVLVVVVVMVVVVLMVVVMVVLLVVVVVVVGGHTHILGLGDSGVGDSDFSGQLRMFMWYSIKHPCVIINKLKKLLDPPPRSTISAVNKFSI